MNRPTQILRSVCCGAVLLSLGLAIPEKSQETFDILEATIPEMRAAMEQGRLTSEALVEHYLDRITRYEDTLNAVVAVNPNALEIARQLDRESREGRTRGPLHGIPIALKDNIHTTDMPTTGGALAFEGFVPPYEATLTRNLREAGAIIIAKTVLTELANWVAGPPTGMPGNYSAVGGYGMNPYDPRPHPGWDGRPVLSVGGSSSGIGTAANLWAANVGTETSGSILTPANDTMLAAIKPTVGRISRHGVIPITGDQDTAGPMARSVTDAAILLGVLEGTQPDPNDPAGGICIPPPGADYTSHLNPEGLRGARIGIPRAYFYEYVNVSGRLRGSGGLNEAQLVLMEEAIAVLRQKGAVIVDPANVPSVVDSSPETNFLAWNICVSAKGEDNACSVVFKYGMKRDFDVWLTTLGTAAPVSSLTELRQWNLDHRSENAIKYGQSLLDFSDEMDLEADRQRYETDRRRDLTLARTRGIDAVIAEYELDALLFPGPRGANLSARAGYPTVTVPFGVIPNSPGRRLPDGFDPEPAPFGVSFAGRACTEPRLIELAYAFEQATQRRVPPGGAP